ncbi:MAG TPA: SGNH/GDSL hydrolase family protein [Acidimicrobiia bacterium]|nr:SGNH/GDSL hydrolase family protein [Acidimicrobiia bacterium]
MTRRAPAALAVVLTVAVALAACSHASSSGGLAAPTTATAAQEVFVAFGSTAGLGSGLADNLRDAWPQVVFRDSFPFSTVLINLSDDPLPIDDAVTLQLPVALEQHAKAAAIWLGPTRGDCTTDTTATMFTPQLTALVKPLRDSGARVAVGNLPDGVPCAVAFNAAVTNVARANGATVADVASALASTPTIGPSSKITVAQGHAVAAAFGAALAPS